MASIEEIFSSLPEIFPRNEVGKLTHGIIQPGTCSNLDSLGLGVEGRFLIGNKVVYPRDAFLKWLKARVKAPQGKN